MDTLDPFEPDGWADLPNGASRAPPFIDEPRGIWRARNGPNREYQRRNAHPVKESRRVLFPDRSDDAHVLPDGEPPVDPTARVDANE